VVAKSQSYRHTTKFGGVPTLSLLNAAQIQTMLLYYATVLQVQKNCHPAIPMEHLS